jgi:flavin-dependent dehydrogenase
MMASRRPRSVAILGDGPAGTTLATLLARSGSRVALYSPGQRPELLVGESLVPAIIPMLRDLGVEDEIRSFSVYKPGATFILDSERSLRFEFGDVKGKLPGYAYNTPRDLFDASLTRACERSGAHVIPCRGRVEKSSDGQGVRLARESVEAADGYFGSGGDAQPDLIVDATGRARTLARLLDLPTREGDRRDHALFAHWKGVALDQPGDVHTDRLEHGWAWRIPLGDRVSLGVVVDPAALRGFGNSSVEQYEGYISSEPRLKRLTDGAERLTNVLRYDNYQLVSERGVGPGWALLGDALGFVDPVFSSGLYLAMDGAYRLAGAIDKGTPAAYSRYEKAMIHHIQAWQRVVGYFYDGRLFTLFLVGEQMAENWIGKLVSPHASKHLPRIFTGEATTKTYSRKLLDFMIQHALLEHDPRELMVR